MGGCCANVPREEKQPEEDWVLFIFLYFGELTQESFTSNKYVCVFVSYGYTDARVLHHMYI